MAKIVTYSFSLSSAHLAVTAQTIPQLCKKLQLESKDNQNYKTYTLKVQNREIKIEVPK